MIGTRVYGYNGSVLLNPGEYALYNNYVFLCTPNGNHSTIDRNIWNVIEHEDYTISIIPSIRISTLDGIELWHGFLESGNFREC